MSLKTYKILIVEDEYIPANYIKKILEQYGHTVLGIADSKDKALEYLKLDTLPELLLMDIKIKGDADGITTAKEFQNFANVCVLYMSAYSDESFLLRAKETNPIGYLVKPVQAQTLTSTIEIGMANFKQSSVSFNFHPDEHTISYDNKKINLTVHENKILAALIKHKNQLISYEMLEDAAWENDIAGDGALRTTIWRLRKKLPNNITIENLYSSGYKLII